MMALAVNSWRVITGRWSSGFSVLTWSPGRVRGRGFQRIFFLLYWLSMIFAAKVMLKRRHDIGSRGRDVVRF
ncbi:MAG TPA: hypothetical protein VF774_28200, partial [Pseudoduganella sp.]